MPSTLKKRKMAKLLIETGSVAGVHDMKEENILDESKPPASSTVHEESWAEMSKEVK